MNARNGSRLCRRVWVLNYPPRRSAFAERRKGSLELSSDGLTVRSQTGDISVSQIESVSVGHAGSDLVNDWVRVVGIVEGERAEIFLADGRWFGWFNFAARSTRRIARQIASRSNLDLQRIPADLIADDPVTQSVRRFPIPAAALLALCLAVPLGSLASSIPLVVAVSFFGFLAMVRMLVDQ